MLLSVVLGCFKTVVGCKILFRLFRFRFVTVFKVFVLDRLDQVAVCFSLFLVVPCCFVSGCSGCF